MSAVYHPPAPDPARGIQLEQLELEQKYQWVCRWTDRQTGLRTCPIPARCMQHPLRQASGITRAASPSRGWPCGRQLKRGEREDGFLQLLVVPQQ